ncbi:hypothetical protein Bhyg_17683 [Pseudolycoriella hygida]|uniref:Uncharacterized protein n=1 Tax=Pseudolycoriella hygida TaxID=35572 RepID=A0A9Q0MHN8_9DIPT|nr:hypothetical protein Bhyg_17683 [Pseudolycoriella hygida]
MKIYVSFPIIFMVHVCCLESGHAVSVAHPSTIRRTVHSAISKRRNGDPLAVATKHATRFVEKHVAEGQSSDGSKKHGHGEHHNAFEEKKRSKGLHHKSSQDSSSAKKGSDTKESHSKKYDEEAGHDKKSGDEADESSFHEDGDHKVYDSAHKEANDKKVRRFEQGFYKSYHKKERNKKDKFFEDHHKGGEYKKYGQGKEKHYSTSSVKKSKKDGKTSSTSTFEDSKKKSKIK